ncbi:MAG: VWA domain-containing protein [Verrucomicrobium sp.]|nr:VWA domain-containing protein [Verrucomicrobium sp.]
MSGSNSALPPAFRRLLLVLGIVLGYLLLLWLARNVPLSFRGGPQGASGSPLGVELAAPPPPPAEKRVTVPSRLAPAASLSASATVSAPVSAAATADGASSSPGPASPAQVYGAVTAAHRFVYLIDVSGSMLMEGPNGRSRFDRAVEEIRRALEALPPEAAFDVIFFADRPLLLSPSFILADAEAKQRAYAFLGNLPDLGGGTNLEEGLAAALRLGPEVIFLLTDGGANEPDWKLLRAVRQMEDAAPAPARLYAFGLANPMDPDDARLLQKLCRQSGGSYQSVDPATSWR